MQSRRHFLKSSALAGGASLIPAQLWAKNKAEVKFKISLQPGAIGVQCTQEEMIGLATKFGFEAIAPYPDSIVAWSTKQKESYLSEMHAAKLVWGSAALPMDFRKDDLSYHEGLKRLPKQAKALQSVGVTRMHTWIMPTHPYRTYRQNFELHKGRLRYIAEILAQFDIRFGLEHVGPKTLMTRDQFAFIRTLRELRELIYEIGGANVGVVLDSFHWHCTGGNQKEISELYADEIIAVDLNDARIGLSPDTQVDNKRELPAATGVIDIKSFLEALVKLEYDGPVRAEPFNQKLNDMKDKEALIATKKSIQKCIDML